MKKPIIHEDIRHRFSEQDLKDLLVKPCPFCGNEDIVINRYETDEEFSISCYKLYCDCCFAELPCGTNLKEAAEEWNTREYKGEDNMSIRNLTPVYICDRCHSEQDSKMKRIAGMDICESCEEELLNTLNIFFSNGKVEYENPCESCSFTAGRRCEQCNYGWIPTEEKLKRYNRIKGPIRKMTDIIKFEEE